VEQIKQPRSYYKLTIDQNTTFILFGEYFLGSVKKFMKLRPYIFNTVCQPYAIGKKLSLMCVDQLWLLIYV
jgi:hypothetical protein